MRICSIENCDNKHYGKDLCKAHYQKLYRSEDNIIANIEIRDYNKYSKCSIEGCSNNPTAKGLCGTHYTQTRKVNKTYKQNNKLREDINFVYKDRNNWSLSVKEIFTDKCMICNWDEAPCDVHHIKPHRESGPNSLNNAIVLCPNHHKLADIGKLDRVYLQQITDNKIISLEELKENI